MQGAGACERCNTEQSERNYRYILSLNFSDSTGSQWITMFDSEGIQFMGMSANKLALIKEGEGDDIYANQLRKPLFQSYNLVVRSKMEMVQDETKLKSVVLHIEPVNYTLESYMILDAISRYN